MAGGLVDLVTAAVATFIWYLTSPDLFINQVAYRVAIINGVAGILINYNPLMKYDGYFFLSDYLGIPNLRADSFTFMGNRIRALLRVPYEEELNSSREKKIFWIYGTCGLLYSALVLLAVAFFIGGWLVHMLGGFGYVATAALVLLMTKGPIKRLAAFIHFFALDRAGHFRRYQIPYIAGVVLLLLAFFFLPVSRHVRGDFSLRPGEEVVVRAEEPAVIEAINAKEGECVRAGSSPVELRSHTLSIDLQRARSKLAAAQARRSAAQVAHDRGEAAIQKAEIDAGLALERYHVGRQKKITPIAPFDGVIMTPHLEDRLGSICMPGDTLFVLGELSTLRAEVLLDERDLGIVDDKSLVQLRLDADPGRVHLGRVEMIAPLSSEGAVRETYRVRVLVDNHEGLLRPGMTGIARFSAGKVPPFHHLLGSLAKVFRIEFWI
jgi:putative peptide zinc metalloprotease protein